MGDHGMTLADYLKIFRHRWWVIVLSTLLVAAVVFAITPEEPSDEPPASSYTATATLVASQPSEATQQVSLGRLALFITTGEVPIRAAESVGYTGDPAVLAGEMTVTPNDVAQAITISSTTPEAETAAARANAFADAAVEYFAAQPGPSLEVLQAATPIPNMPTGGAVVPPDRPFRTALGAAIGLLLGLALAILIDHLDGRLRSSAQIGKTTGLPVVAEVPKLSGKQRRRHAILTHEAPLSPYSDAYRAARSALLHFSSAPIEVERHPARAVQTHEETKASGTKAQGTVILVASALAGEGKTTSVANIAASFAETGQDVLVIDGDLRKPDLHPHFDVPQGRGASDFLLNPADVQLSSLMRPTNVPGVRIVTAGTQLHQPAALTSRMAPLIAAAREESEIVILDVSPLLMASDAYDILPLVDNVLLVARSGRLTEASARRASEVLGRFQVPVSGVVVIAPPKGSRSDYGYGSGYGYGYGERPESTLSLVERDEPTADSPAPDSAPSSPGDPRRVLHD